ncbi:transporter [Polynucleobacter sphagniphilus]|uniref:transporter n=1 Tax=Polynucleobacter sphagniphilus TaxID=1743169 RepID=UPI0024754FDD|nr:transporter [Polynucleobacter sphagniphilus]
MSTLFQVCVWWTLALYYGATFGQEIEARAYSNAPIGLNFASAGIAQASSGSYTLTSEVTSFTHILDINGQSGKISLIIPYAELTGSKNVNSQTINASANGFSDPVLKASIPWGSYSNQQLINVGANRWFIQPGVGASQAIGPWRLELEGAATIFTSNTSYIGSNTFSENPIYSTQTHVIYYFPSTAWLSIDTTYFIGGQAFVNGTPINGSQENWRFGSTFSYPIDKHNAIRLSASTGISSRTNNSFDLLGLSWQYRWGPGL